MESFDIYYSNQSVICGTDEVKLVSLFTESAPLRPRGVLPDTHSNMISKCKDKMKSVRLKSKNIVFIHAKNVITF